MTDPNTLNPREKSRKESKVKKRVREALLDRHSRPKDQRKRKERR